MTCWRTARCQWPARSAGPRTVAGALVLEAFPSARRSGPSSRCARSGSRWSPRPPAALRGGVSAAAARPRCVGWPAPPAAEAPIGCSSITTRRAVSLDDSGAVMFSSICGSAGHLPEQPRGRQSNAPRDRSECDLRRLVIPGLLIERRGAGGGSRDSDRGVQVARSPELLQDRRLLHRRGIGTHRHEIGRPAGAVVGVDVPAQVTPVADDRGVVIALRRPENPFLVLAHHQGQHGIVPLRSPDPRQGNIEDADRRREKEGAANAHRDDVKVGRRDPGPVEELVDLFGRGVVRAAGAARSRPR